MRARCASDALHSVTEATLSEFEKAQVPHFVLALRARLKELNEERRRLRRIITSMSAVNTTAIVSTLADAEMLRVTLPSAHSMPRAVCPHCNRNRALHRDREYFYRHEPCGMVRTVDGKRNTEDRWVVNPKTIAESCWT